MELRSVLSRIDEDRSFLNHLKETLGDDGFSNKKTNINELGYLDGYSLKKDSPKVIQSKEIFEPKILKKMKEYFVESDEDLTKRNVRSYISGYKKLCKKPCLPLYYFFTDEEVDNFVIECFDNDLGEILLPRKIIHSDLGNYPFCFIDVIHKLMSNFCEEMLSSDIKTITRKLFPIN